VGGKQIQYNPRSVRHSPFAEPEMNDRCLRIRSLAGPHRECLLRVVSQHSIANYDGLQRVALDSRLEGGSDLVASHRGS
jgi:hypothetical protein